jgi:hypothetical protein
MFIWSFLFLFLFSPELSSVGIIIVWLKVLPLSSLSSFVKSTALPSSTWSVIEVLSSPSSLLTGTCSCHHHHFHHSHHLHQHYFCFKLHV